MPLSLAAPFLFVPLQSASSPWIWKMAGFLLQRRLLRDRCVRVVLQEPRKTKLQKIYSLQCVMGPLQLTVMSTKSAVLKGKLRSGTFKTKEGQT